MYLVGTAVALLATAGCSNDASATEGGAPRSVSTPAPCRPTAVHYEPSTAEDPSLRSLPWVEASPELVGYLFYYAALGWDEPRLRIYTGGRSPDGRLNMKILWELRRGAPGNGLDVTGTRPSDGRTFSQHVDGGTQFPSTIVVPAPGCWRLTLTTGKTSGSVDVDAVAP